MLLELACLVAIVVVIFKYFTVIINENEVMIWESFGKFESVRVRGIYLSKPWERQRTVQWAFRHSEERTLKLLYTNRIPKSTLRYDPLPLICTTRDNFSVKVDLVVNFRIVDAKAAIYNTQNPFSELEDKLETYVYETVRQFSMVDIAIYKLKKEVSLEQLNAECKLSGIMVIDIRIQGITLPEGIVNATVANEQLRLKNEAEIKRIQGERQHNLQLIESKSLEQENQNRMERERANHQNQLKLEAAKTEQDVRRIQMESEFAALEKISAMPHIVPYLIAKEQAKFATELGRSDKGKKVIIFSDAIHANMATLPLAKELLKAK